MILPYQELKTEFVQLSKLTPKNIQKGVVPRYLKKIPAFIMPDGTIMYMTTDHYSANFYEEIEAAFDIIKLNNKQKAIEKLKYLKNILKNDYNKILKGDISAGNVRNYINVDCLHPGLYDCSIRGIFSDECKDVLIMLLKSKIQIYEYFIKIIAESDNMVESLKLYPTAIKPMDCKKYLLNLKNKETNVEQDIYEILYKILEEQASDELNYIIFPDYMQEFAVLSIGIDKIETQVKNTITTTRLNPNEIYFNYKIMGYNIVQIPKIYFDKETQTFKKRIIDEFSISSYYDRKYEEEIELIKKKVPLRERHKYFL